MWHTAFDVTNCEYLIDRVVYGSTYMQYWHWHEKLYKIIMAVMHIYQCHIEWTDEEYIVYINKNLHNIY